MPFVVLPAAGRRGIDRPPHLVPAGRLRVAARLVEPQAGRVPVQLQEVQHLAAHLLGFGDVLLVANLQNRLVEHGLPVRHEPLVLAVVQAGVSEIEGEEVPDGEVLEIAGQAGVDRIPHAVYDPRARKQQRDQSEVQEVARHLVGHPVCVSAQPLQPLELAAGRGIQRLPVEARRTLRDVVRFSKPEPKAAGQPSDIPQLPGRMDIPMARQDLFDQACSRPRHADDEDRQFGAVVGARKFRKPLGREDLDDSIHATRQVPRIERRPAEPVPGLVVCEGLVEPAKLVIELAKGEAQHAPVLVR